MAVNALACVVSYVIGSIPVGYLVARLTGGTDIRRSGSGNIGATNVLRTLGILPAIATLVGDIAKGYLAVRAAGAIASEPWGEAAGAVLAIVGNCWPVFLRFRGGKGVATGFGAFLALVPLATAPTVIVWLAVALSFRFVSLASVTACLCLPIGVAALGYPRAAIVAAVVATVIIVLRHRENLRRLFEGREPRLGQRAGTA